MLHGPHISFFSILSPEQYLVEYKTLSSLGSFLRSPVISSLLRPNILLSTLFSNILILRYSHCKITGLYNLIFTFLDSKLEDEIFCTEWQQVFPDLKPANPN